jgi:hypothetical protein
LYFSKTSTHDITLFCQQFSPHFRKAGDAEASIELVGSSDGSLLGCLSEVEDQFRLGSFVAPRAWNIMER